MKSACLCALFCAHELEEPQGHSCVSEGGPGAIIEADAALCARLASLPGLFPGAELPCIERSWRPSRVQPTAMESPLHAGYLSFVFLFA